jgi:CBS domain-containing protein
VIALGLDPRETELRVIAETPHFTIGPDVSLEEAFRFLETEDAERVPVVDEHHRLVGVLSRSVLQRRLAEDEEPDEGDDLPPAA